LWWLRRILQRTLQLPLQQPSLCPFDRQQVLVEVHLLLLLLLPRPWFP
jgi:hypothetical protein